MRRERPDHTLEPVALVHKALIRLFGRENLPGIPDGGELFAAATKAMDQVLVEHARRRNASKRQGRRDRVPLDQVLASFEEQGLDVIDLRQALERLAQVHPRRAQVVELRFFRGMTISEVAAALRVSDTAVETDWRFARAWLRHQLDSSFHEKPYNRCSALTTPVALAAPPRHRAFLAAAPSAGAPPDAR